MDHTKKIKELTEDILEKLDITCAVSVVTDETNAYRVQIETEETGLLIGFHGRTLESFQILLNFIVAKAVGSWEKIYVNVGDYREKREEALMIMAQRAADRAIALARPVELSHLSASERRVVHLTLSGDDRVETESVGEGSGRVLMVKPKDSDSPPSGTV